ncbi:ABC transporter ATP-binding protein [Enterovirga sp. CN4-39]|uniref:ABC transporter ATP-binding protein n=1 Tax=Enterovirga sp. CN4-39 TaxID=3400910 RepID=UPI003C011AA7
MLQLRNVSAGYGGVVVLQDVSVDVAPGEVVTIVGANGAGKTTTLRTIAGLLAPQAGSITLDGDRIDGLAPHVVVEKGITLVPEGRQLFPFMSVRDNLLMGAYSRKARGQAGKTLAEMVDLFPRLGERLDQLAGSLSGGEQQMVAIARGLMSRPRLLMFDEPSLGLAPIMVKHVFRTIDWIVQTGTTILLVEQNVFQTLSIAHRAYVLENGAIRLSGTGRELLGNDHVRRAYLGI